MSICSKEISKINSEALGFDFSFSYATSIAEIGEDWDDVAADSFFFHSSYQEYLERFPPKSMEFCYCLVQKQGQPFGIFPFQIIVFSAEQSIHDDEQVASQKSIFSSITKFFRTHLAEKVKLNAIVSGNLLLTGEYAYKFKEEVPKELRTQILDKAIAGVQDLLRKNGKDINFFLLKDFFEGSRIQEKGIDEQDFNEFTVQPTMTLDIQWDKFEDYLSSMTSKYRVRYRRARKKLEGIEKRELGENELAQYSKEINSMYLSIAKKSGFNMVLLNPEYLSNLKNHFGKKVKIFGYFLKEEFIGYITLIDKGDELDAHFLGYKQEVNHAYQLYLNMLYDMVDISIQYKFSHLHLSRTALEIKSSVGAKAQKMYFYIKSRKALQNKFAPLIMEYLKPNDDWVARNPFKNSNS